MFKADPIIAEVVANVWSRVFWLGQELFFGGISNMPPANLDQTPLGEQIRLLVRVANGEAADPDTLGEAAECMQHVCEVLFVSPAGAYAYQIPASFWETELGRVILHCQLRLRGDDLISHSEASTILFGDNSPKNLNKLARWIADGKLRSYIDPKEANPQHNKRVSRQEVESLL